MPNQMRLARGLRLAMKASSASPVGKSPEANPAKRCLLSDRNCAADAKRLAITDAATKIRRKLGPDSPSTSAVFSAETYRCSRSLKRWVPDP
eukprot:scaffold1340_cov253-Pinguiococcus_pyrenoidosus.AAC.33